MTKIQKHKKGGFIKTIVILIVVIATLSYFKIDIASIVESAPVQAVWSFTKTLFTNYVAPATEYVWNNILRDFIFENVVDFFTKAEEQITDTNIEDLINLATSTPETN